MPERRLERTRQAAHTRRTAPAYNLAPLRDPAGLDATVALAEARAASTRELERIAGTDGEAATASADFRWTATRVAIVATVVLYLLVVLVAPLAALVIETVRTGIPAVLRALATPEAVFAIRQTLVLTVIAVAVNGVLGVAIALVLVRQRFVGRQVLDALVDLSLAVSPVMVGLSFLIVLGRDGWVWPWLEAAGLRVAFAFPGLVVATLFVTLPYTVREVAHVLVEVGEDEEAVAATLGASAWRTFWFVTLPNIRRGLLLGLTLTAARALGEFGAVLVLGGAIARKTESATTYIFGALEERQAAGAYGMSLLLGVASIALLIIIERFKQRSPGA